MQATMEQRTGDMVTIEDHQQKACLGAELWSLQQEEHFTDVVMIGKESDSIKAHLCVLSIASPLIKNQAMNGSLACNSDGLLSIPVSKYTCEMINYFISFAYRGFVVVPPEDVGELYNLADYFMDITLQTAITDTVGSIPANIPNIVEVLRSSEHLANFKKEEKIEAARDDDEEDIGDDCAEDDVAEAENTDNLAEEPLQPVEPQSKPEVQLPQTPKRKRGRPPKKLVKSSSRSPATPSSGDGGIRRKSAIEASQKIGDMDDGVVYDESGSYTPTRRIFKRRAKMGIYGGGSSKTSPGRKKVGRKAESELEWVDGKPNTICKECKITICHHRVTIISPAELEYHIKHEGGMVVDPGEAVEKSIDGLLSMAQQEQEVGIAQQEVDNLQQEVDNQEQTTSEGANHVEVTGDKEEVGEDEKPVIDDKNVSLTPLRAKYKLWVDPVSRKTKKLFPCEYCGNLYVSFARLIRHVPSHTGIFPFACPLCSATYKTKDELTKHDRKKHDGKAAVGFEDGIFKCPQCAVKYNCEEALKKHISNHNNDTRVPKTKYVLKRKPSSNRLIKTYPCDKCGAEFTKASEFEGHMASHTGIKLYECRLCNKKFGMESYMKKHMLRHVEEKKYICALCGASFKTSSGLYTHEHSVHIETKPYICDLCGKEFKMKWSMKEHLRMSHSNYVLPKGHTSEWQCSQCGEFLPSEMMFKIHEKLHVTDKPFKCRLCPESFKYRAARLNHERREHQGACQDPRLVMPKEPKLKEKKEKKKKAHQPSKHPNSSSITLINHQELITDAYYPNITHTMHHSQMMQPAHSRQDLDMQQVPGQGALPAPVCTVPLLGNEHYPGSGAPTPTGASTPTDFHSRGSTPIPPPSHSNNVNNLLPPPPAPLPQQPGNPTIAQTVLYTAPSTVGQSVYDNSYYMAAAAAVGQMTEDERLPPQPFPAICSICNVSFESQASLWSHMAVHGALA